MEHLWKQEISFLYKGKMSGELKPLLASLKTTNLCLNDLSAFLLVSVSSLSNVFKREPPPTSPPFLFEDFPVENNLALTCSLKLTVIYAKENTFQLQKQGIGLLGVH